MTPSETFSGELCTTDRPRKSRLFLIIDSTSALALTFLEEATLVSFDASICTVIFGEVQTEDSF